MLSSFVVGIIWGVMLGPVYEHSFALSRVLVNLAITAAIIGLFIKFNSRFFRASLHLRYVLEVSACCLSGFLWAFSYSPPMIGFKTESMEVTYATGCGDHNVDLIIHSNGRLYAARGQAIRGDIVRFDAQGSRLNRGLIIVERPAGEIGFICNIVAKARLFYLGLLSRYPHDVRVWMSAFIFGEQKYLERMLVHDFRGVGILHALVLSGGHLALLMAVTQSTIRLPIHLGFIARSVSMNWWMRVWIFSRILALVFLTFFCFLVGMAQSIQRAILSICLMVFFEIFGFPVKHSSTILSVLAAQAVIFPANFLSVSMLLSWSGVLILRAFYRSTFRKKWHQILLQAVMIQTVFTVMTLLFFGSVGILSVPINVLSLATFGVLLPLDCFGLLLQWTWLDHILIDVNRSVLECISWAAVLQDSLPVTKLTLPATWGRDTAIGRLMIFGFISGIYGLAITFEKPSRRALSS
jgi:hypothetical protein